MINLYVSPSCTSCRKARQWLDDHNLEYTEKNVQKDPMTEEELKKILSLTENGTEEIISFRSKAYQNLNVDIEEISMDELIELFIEYPSLVRRPIIMDDRRLQIGYNEEEIRCFLPRSIRKIKRVEMYEKIKAAGI